MRFLVDECVISAITQYLRNDGHDVLAVAEITPRAEDTDILSWAVREKRIVVTNDKDFGELVFRSGQTHQGVILFRLRDESVSNQLRVVASLLSRHSNRLSGYFVVVTDSDVRIHPKTPVASEGETT